MIWQNDVKILWKYNIFMFVCERLASYVFPCKGIFTKIETPCTLLRLTKS